MKTVSDIAKKVMLCGPGRGSAAGSLVVYCLNITEIEDVIEKLLIWLLNRS
jgi:DNA polymerase III alpha subunit